MPTPERYVVALYDPRTSTACDALAGYLRTAGLQTSVKLPEGPETASKLAYGVQQYASFRLALPNGKQPSREIVEAAVQQAHAKLKARFGHAALDLNGTLIGSIPKGP